MQSPYFHGFDLQPTVHQVPNSDRLPIENRPGMVFTMFDKKDETKNLAAANKRPIRAPSQVRSQKAMDRVLATLETLLLEKRFDEITIQELAQRSKTSTSSIYARFRDKQALVLGVHLSLREKALECLDELTDQQRWAGESTARIVAGCVPPSVKFYRKHGPLIRAALLVDDAEMRERQASVLRNAAARFSQLIPSNSPKEARAVDAAVDFSVKMFASVMYSSLMFGAVEIGRKPMSDREITRHLVQAITAAIEHAQVR